MNAIEVDQMPLHDKLATMEKLWESISQRPEKVVSPPWHREVLAGRRKKIREGTAKFITLGELHRQLAR